MCGRNIRFSVDFRPNPTANKPPYERASLYHSRMPSAIPVCRGSIVSLGETIDFLEFLVHGFLGVCRIVVVSLHKPLAEFF